MQRRSRISLSSTNPSCWIHDGCEPGSSTSQHVKGYSGLAAVINNLASSSEPSVEKYDPPTEKPRLKSLIKLEDLLRPSPSLKLAGTRRAVSAPSPLPPSTILSSESSHAPKHFPLSKSWAKLSASKNRIISISGLKSCYSAQLSDSTTLEGTETTDQSLSHSIAHNSVDDDSSLHTSASSNSSIHSDLNRNVKCLTGSVLKHVQAPLDETSRSSDHPTSLPRSEQSHPETQEDKFLVPNEIPFKLQDPISNLSTDSHPHRTLKQKNASKKTISPVRDTHIRPPPLIQEGIINHGAFQNFKQTKDRSNSHKTSNSSNEASSTQDMVASHNQEINHVSSPPISPKASEISEKITQEAENPHETQSVINSEIQSPPIFPACVSHREEDLKLGHYCDFPQGSRSETVRITTKGLSPLIRPVKYGLLQLFSEKQGGEVQREPLQVRLWLFRNLPENIPGNLLIISSNGDKIELMQSDINWKKDPTSEELQRAYQAAQPRVLFYTSSALPPPIRVVYNYLRKLLMILLSAVPRTVFQLHTRRFQQPTRCAMMMNLPIPDLELEWRGKLRIKISRARAKVKIWSESEIYTGHCDKSGKISDELLKNLKSALLEQDDSKLEMLEDWLGLVEPFIEVSNMINEALDSVEV
ncbi:hypothetical protein O181_027549 [Austropuccinia psidii MF-1]|uniref:Uncharacterized protein n=1 Tax=Austropuccinia psidii MF-1 TaxID=1389203 RepID=A0A9Q3CP75_9BASI|nr:hypothetical protein [Austropuccinia psidii MF-1]